MEAPDRPVFTVAGLPPAHEPPPGAAAGGQQKAHWGYRMGAGLIDLVLPLAVASVIDASGHSTHDAQAYAGMSLFGVWFLNVGVLAGINGGRSVGKLVAGTRVVRENGERYGVGMALLRDVVLRFIHLIPLVIVVDALLPVRADRRSLRDAILSTDVVHAPPDARRGSLLALAAPGALALTIFLFAQTDAFHTDYSDYQRKQYVSECTEAGSSERTCECAFRRVKAQLTYAEYDEAHGQDPEDRSAHAARVLDDATEDCPR